MDEATKQYLDLMRESINDKIETSNKTTTRAISALKEAQDRGFSKINGRVRKTEGRINWIIGLGSGVVFVIGCVGFILKFM